ncbi:MAG: hypothetical protein V4521_02175 [Pseudomonadota bacterium]
MIRAPYQYFAASDVAFAEGEPIGAQVTGFHVLDGAWRDIERDAYGLGFVVEEWAGWQGKPGTLYYVRCGIDETITADWQDAMRVASEAMAGLGHDSDDWQDIAACETCEAATDALLAFADKHGLDHHCAEEMQFDEGVDAPMCAWLRSFCIRWEYLQAREDFEAAIAARGER